jgi:DNA polymerase III subunit epsilon
VTRHGLEGVPAFHRAPMLGFDLETTGVDVFEDRIVTASVVIRVGPDQELVKHRWLVDPGVEIPAEATKVHGISTEYARAEGMDPKTAVEEIVQVIDKFWEVCPTGSLTAFNASYDLSLLLAECGRYGLEALEDPFPVIDPLVIDKQADKYRPGSRRLEDVAKHYGVVHRGAHDAENDVLACMQIAYALPEFHPKLDEPAALVHQWQIGWAAEQAAGYQQYLRQKKGQPDAVVSGAWPLAVR